MKAAQINSYGGKEVLQINPEAEKPSISDDQLLIEVAAAAVNPFDITVRNGGAQQMAQLNFPATLGGDFAGRVVEVGAKVTGFQNGEMVYGQADALSGNGSFAEFTPVKASQTAKAPDGIDTITAAAFPLVSSSAYQALVDHINLQPGQKILIHGGAGGIGSMAVQLAKNLGAYVATTVSDQEKDYAKNLGADEIIDYKSQDFSEILKDYDAVFDTVGGETNLKSYQVLKPGGSFVSMVAQPDKELVERHDLNYTAQLTHVTTERLTKIAELVESRKLSINIDKVFPLDQTAEALDHLESGHPRGKVVIQIKT